MIHPPIDNLFAQRARPRSPAERYQGRTRCLERRPLDLCSGSAGISGAYATAFGTSGRAADAGDVGTQAGSVRRAWAVASVTGAWWPLEPFARPTVGHPRIQKSSNQGKAWLEG